MPNKKTTLKRAAKWIGTGILASAILAGLIPVSADEYISYPNPVVDYDEAAARFEVILAEELPIVNDLSGSLLMTHGKPTEQVYIFIHGITNSPLQWKELGEMLHEQGNNILILRMPYHGLKSHKVGELGVLSTADLRDYADDAVDIASGLGKEITVIGISGGATVASWMGQNRPEVKKIVAISPFFGMASLPAFLDSFVTNLGHRMPNIVLDTFWEQRRAWVYRGETTHAPAEFMLLGRSVFEQAKISEAEADASLFLTTAVDTTADNDYVDKLIEIWGKGKIDITFFQFDESYNIPHNSVDPTTDPEIRNLIYDKISEWVEDKK